MPPITINKRYGYKISVTQGSDKVTACSKANWSQVRLGSFITISGDQIYYRIVNKDKFLYEEEVEVANQSTLRVNKNVGSMLNIDDDISFTHKEYEISSVSISKGGEGYETGDVLKLEGGLCKYNSSDEIDLPCQLKVLSVSGAGSITDVEITQNGSYILPPSNECFSSLGKGTGAEFLSTNNMLNKSALEDRSISDIELNSDHSLIYLNSPLPPRLKSGVIKVEKWELTLNRNYLSDSKFNANYEIAKDFTPHYELPLMNNMNSNSSFLLYNEAVTLIDQKLKELEDKLGS